MSAHTPGPWRGSDSGVAAADDRAVCVMAESRGGDESAANRRLIAAAPDLLAEHERDLDQINLIEIWLIRAGYPPTNPAMAAVGEMVKAKRAAIAKARGGK